MQATAMGASYPNQERATAPHRAATSTHRAIHGAVKGGKMHHAPFPALGHA